MQVIISRGDDQGGVAALATATPWQAVLNAYLDTLNSPDTRRSYARHIRDALTALQVTTLAELTGVDLGRYRAAVRDSQHASGSQALALAALRSFLRWAGRMGAHSLPREMVLEQLKTPPAGCADPT